MKKAFILILTIHTIIFAASGQNISVTAAFDSARIFIGDQIHFAITVDQPSDMRLTLPAFKDTLVNKVEILSGPETDTIKGDQGHLKIVEKYIITSFDSGQYRIPPVFVEVKNSGGLNRYYSGAALLEVVKYRIAPADSTTKIYDIIGPYKAPVTLAEILPWILLVIVLAIIIWFTVRWLRSRRSSRAEIAHPVIREPAHVIAFRELENLRLQELWQKGNYRQYYTSLTEILRRYLENRYYVYSLELTTSETLNALLQTGFKRDAFFDRLKSVLVSADLVKFAKHIPGNEENELHFRSAWDFVEGTKQVIVEQPESEHDGKEGSV